MSVALSLYIGHTCSLDSRSAAQKITHTNIHRQAVTYGEDHRDQMKEERGLLCFLNIVLQHFQIFWTCAIVIPWYL